MPRLSVHSGHVHQLGEVEFVSGVSAEEPGFQLRRPGELQQLLTATLIRLEAKQSQKDQWLPQDEGDYSNVDLQHS